MSTLSQRLRNLWSNNPITRLKRTRRYRRTTAFLQRHPFTSFFAALGVLLLFIILGSVLSNLGQKEEKQVTPTKPVHIYSIGKSPTVELQAQVESNGVVQIVAQAPGIVQQVHVSEGDTVNKGQSIISLSSNYQGGNAPALQAQLANAQLKNVNETYGLQKDILKEQRNIATASAENTEQLRQISERSLGETRDLLNFNDSLLNTLVDQIEAIEAANPADPNLATLRGQQAQLQAGVNQLRSAVRNIEYSTNQQNPPTVLANAQKQIALKQLDLQEKALDLNKQVSQIQYNLALVQEGTMHPASPFKGVIERINVHVGQNVNPGTVIATVACLNRNATAVLHASRDIAQGISRIEPSIFTINEEKIAVIPSYVSTVATDGQLYTIIYDLPDESISEITDQQYLPVAIPVGYANTNSVIPFVPIDSVYASQNESTVYVIEKNKAVARKIATGQLYGEYVEVKSGLKNGDKIILDRTVVNGDSVKVIK